MICVVANEKGGVGKTATATNLAVMRALLAKRDVLLVDADTQGSSAFWADLRSELDVSPTITCVSITTKEIGKEVRRMAPKFDDIIIDVAAQNSACMWSALAVADVVVTPFIPSLADAEVVVRSMDPKISDAKLNNLKLRALLFMNQMDPNPKSKQARNATEYVRENTESYDYREDIRVVNRTAFRLAFALGRGVLELEGREFGKDVEKESLHKAIEEIAAVYKMVFNEPKE